MKRECKTLIISKDNEDLMERSIDSYHNQIGKDKYVEASRYSSMKNVNGTEVEMMTVNFILREDINIDQIPNDAEVIM